MSNIFRFSGHESFPCRYAWLPKVYNALSEDPETFSDDDKSMVSLGVGKNMVRSIRFWMQVMEVAEPSDDGGYRITDFGKAVFSPDGFDPFLEDIRTLWLLHWHVSTNVNQPLFAWDYLLNKWHLPEISKMKALDSFRKEADKLGRELSDVTLAQHFDIFLHSYVPTRTTKGKIVEDNLDCPLVELELIQIIGERSDGKTGKREALYAFRREDKSEITSGLFIYCLYDYWKKYQSNEKTLSFRDISNAHGSPGQIFKLPESAIRNHLDTIEVDSRNIFTYKESASIQQIVLNKEPEESLLTSVYKPERVYA